MTRNNNGLDVACMRIARKDFPSDELQDDVKLQCAIDRRHFVLFFPKIDADQSSTFGDT